MMGDGASVLVQRRRLVAELKKARLDKGETQGQTADAMDWSLSKIQRIEKGTSGIKTNDLKVLLQFYGIADAEKQKRLLELGREARKPPWWRAYKNYAPKGLLTLIEYESVASVIRQFETLFIPGILQTEEYARGILAAYYNNAEASSDRISALVELRTRRRELLDVENPPRFHFVLDESTIRRAVGGHSVMRQQLRRVIEVAERPNVTVEVVPFSAGSHPGMRGPFEIIEFADGLSNDVVSEESSRGDNFIDNREKILNFRETFEQLEKMSLGLRDSVALLGEVADGMK